MSYNEYVIFSKIRVLDSCYENVPYTIRILRQTNSKKCESIFKTISEFRGIIEIYDNKENFLVPSVYTGRSENYGKLEIVTWHTRYSELPLGKYHIEGKLQLDIKTNKIIVVPDLGGKIDPIEIWS